MRLPYLFIRRPIFAALLCLALPVGAFAQGLCVVVDRYCGGGSTTTTTTTTTDPTDPDACSETATEHAECIDPFTGDLVEATRSRTQSLVGDACAWGSWTAWSPSDADCSSN